MKLFPRSNPINNASSRSVVGSDPDPLVKVRSGGVLYLLRDEFITDAVAPLTSPRNAEPGPGALTLVQTIANFSVSGGALQYVVPGVPGWNTYSFSERTTPYARVAGRALLVSDSIATLGAGSGRVIGWGSTAAPTISSAQHMVQIIATGILAYDGTLATTLQSASTTTYPIAIVLRVTGAFIFVKLSGTWTLMFIFVNVSTTPMFPTFNNNNGAGGLDYFRVRDLGGAFSTDNGIATVDQASPATGTTFAGTANLIADLSFTLGAGSASLVGAELRYRYQDASNYWTAYIKRNAGNTAWDFFLDSVAAGTPTNRTTVTGAGTPDMVRIIADGNNHDCYTKAGSTWTKRGSTVSNASLNTQTTVSPVFDASTTGGALRAYPRASSLFNVLDQV
jgi:hypothetical protein